MADTTPLQAVLTVLTAAGWEPDGATRMESVRVPTRKSPLTCSGKGGGELRTFGGRVRYKRGERRVTVGKRSVYFYGVGVGAMFDTKDLTGITEAAK